MLSSPPDLRLLLVGLSSGLTLSFFTSAVACLLTPVWSVTIILPKALTSLLVPFDWASLPALMSTWFAVTTMCAICGSVGPAPCAKAPPAARINALAKTMLDDFMVLLLFESRLDFKVGHSHTQTSEFGCINFAIH